MVNLMDPSVINDMIRVTPGAVPVSFLGIEGWGHEAHVPVLAGEEGVGVLASEPSVVVADNYFPGIGLDWNEGSAAGTDEDFTIGDFVWTVRGIEPGEAPGEIRVFLTNRRTSG